MVRLHFIKPGLWTTVQDNGRIGYQNFGVPVGGVMDKKAAQQANQLVGNSLETPILEITMLGPQIIFQGDCQIAITGADLSPTLNKQPISNYETIHVSSNSVLAFGQLRQGCRTYLAVRGQWKIKPWLGSCSAMPFGDKTATPQSLIQKDSFIDVQTLPLIAPQRTALEDRPVFKKIVKIALMAGPEWNYLTLRQVAHLFSTTYKIHKDSNRMGYRLDPSLPNFEFSSPLISSGIVPGTVQVTNEGQLIILLLDAQTMGGYPRIGNITQDAINNLAQAKPGDSIRFEFKEDK
ncbi:MAG: biotin-dependent carboxyltransferase family protein [Saprospiraceae bacterium]|nr:biotin-dependent carboxyltransferase family protein [Saprospiraceae bacterium]